MFQPMDFSFAGNAHPHSASSYNHCPPFLTDSLREILKHIVEGEGGAAMSAPKSAGRVPVASAITSASPSISMPHSYVLGHAPGQGQGQAQAKVPCSKSPTFTRASTHVPSSVPMPTPMPTSIPMPMATTTTLSPAPMTSAPTPSIPPLKEEPKLTRGAKRMRSSSLNSGCTPSSLNNAQGQTGTLFKVNHFMDVTNQQVVVEALLPGYRAQDITVTLNTKARDMHELVIAACGRNLEDTKLMQTVVQEIPKFTNVARRLWLNIVLDRERVRESVLGEGVLRITIPYCVLKDGPVETIATVNRAERLQRDSSIKPTMVEGTTDLKETKAEFGSSRTPASEVVAGCRAMLRALGQAVREHSTSGPSRDNAGEANPENPEAMTAAPPVSVPNDAVATD